jgi:hypothetical protein
MQKRRKGKAQSSLQVRLAAVSCQVVLNCPTCYTPGCQITCRIYSIMLRLCFFNVLSDNDRSTTPILPQRGITAERDATQDWRPRSRYEQSSLLECHLLIVDILLPVPTNSRRITPKVLAEQALFRFNSLIDLSSSLSLDQASELFGFTNVSLDAKSEDVRMLRDARKRLSVESPGAGPESSCCRAGCNLVTASLSYWWMYLEASNRISSAALLRLDHLTSCVSLAHSS